MSRNKTDVLPGPNIPIRMLDDPHYLQGHKVHSRFRSASLSLEVCKVSVTLARQTITTIHIRKMKTKDMTFPSLRVERDTGKITEGESETQHVRFLLNKLMNELMNETSKQRGGT
jgi:hypothetical protein